MKESDKLSYKEQKFDNVVRWFAENVPVAETELHYGSPFQLLVAVILSAHLFRREDDGRIGRRARVFWRLGGLRFRGRSVCGIGF